MFRAGWMSLTWRGVPSTSIACSLTMQVIYPLRKWMVHRLLGGFTQTVSPNSYGPLVPCRSGRHVLMPLMRTSVPMDCIGGCARSSHNILWLYIIPIDRFCDRACLPRDPLHALVAPLCNAVATRHIRTSVSEPDPPLVYETPKLHAAEGCVIIRELESIFYERGPPEEILTDNDTAFWATVISLRDMSALPNWVGNGARECGCAQRWGSTSHQRDQTFGWLVDYWNSGEYFSFLFFLCIRSLTCTLDTNEPSFIESCH